MFRRRKSCDAAIQEIISKNGRLDVVVHNAGHMVFGPAEAFTPEQLAELYDVNVLSTQRVNRAALPQLRKQRKGLVIWVSSSSSAGGTPPYLAPWSQRSTGQGSVRENVADLAALIEKLGLAPAWVVGGSFGASITLRLAGERPDLFRGLIAHEPLLFALLVDDPAVGPMLNEVTQRLAAVIGRIASGDHAGAAEQFVDTVAFGPGAWAQLPPDFQQTLIENAPTFLDESNDPEQHAFDLEWIKRFSRPSLLTTGNQSPPIFAPLIAKLAYALPKVKTITLAGAGHIPHVTHPDAYIEIIRKFIGKNST
jgi:pimeloyl-ACP methyl ester carboxylesterase